MRARQVVFLTSLLNAGAADCNSGATMKKYKFKATIQPGISGGAVFPYDVEREFGTRARVPVKSTLDGVPYSGSLIKCRGTYAECAQSDSRADRQRTRRSGRSTFPLLLLRCSRSKAFWLVLKNSVTPTARNIAAGLLRPKKKRADRVAWQRLLRCSAEA